MSEHDAQFQMNNDQTDDLINIMKIEELFPHLVARLILLPIQTKRKVSESMKKYIASNQKWLCNICKLMLDESYEIDHINPLFEGGNNELFNLQALCRNCHGKKKVSEKLHIPVTIGQLLNKSMTLEHVLKNDTHMKSYLEQKCSIIGASQDMKSYIKFYCKKITVIKKFTNGIQLNDIKTVEHILKNEIHQNDPDEIEYLEKYLLCDSVHTYKDLWEELSISSYNDKQSWTTRLIHQLDRDTTSIRKSNPIHDKFFHRISMLPRAKEDIDAEEEWMKQFAKKNSTSRY